MEMDKLDDSDPWIYAGTEMLTLTVEINLNCLNANPTVFEAPSENEILQSFG